MAAADAEKPVALEACGVPFRLRDGRMEFCLVSIEADSRWEFPHCPLRQTDDPAQAALHCATQLAAITCRLVSDEPLGEFSTPRDDAILKTTGFLLEAAEAAKTSSGRRVRWCFAEEARARIRRKPMRRFVDLALRRQASS